MKYNTQRRPKAFSLSIANGNEETITADAPLWFLQITNNSESTDVSVTLNEDAEGCTFILDHGTAQTFNQRDADITSVTIANLFSGASTATVDVLMSVTGSDPVLED